jgi:hypothetical protein
MGHEPIPDEIRQLQELGQAGKLWALQIVFTWDGETKTVTHRNLTNAQVMQIRKDIFLCGFIHPISQGSWRVVCPIDIDRVYLDRQSGYFSG